MPHVAPRAAVVTALALAAVFSSAACGSSAADMETRAKRLLPEKSEIVARETADCTIGVVSPSCMNLFFASPARTLEARVNAVRAAAEADGWISRGETPTRSAMILSFHSDDLSATVFIREAAPGTRCDEPRPWKPCADLARVVITG